MSDPTAIADVPEDDGDADNIKLFPAWRQTLAELEQAGIHAGQVISKRWLDERFGIREPLTIQEAERNRFIFLRSMTSLREALLEKHQYMLRSVPGVGYEIIPPERQTDVALRDRGEQIRRALQTLAIELTYIRADELTDEQRRQNTGALAKVGALAGMAGRQLGYSKE